MKKYISLILASLCVLSLCACGEIEEMSIGENSSTNVDISENSSPITENGESSIIEIDIGKSYFGEAIKNKEALFPLYCDESGTNENPFTQEDYDRIYVLCDDPTERPSLDQKNVLPETQKYTEHDVPQYSTVTINGIEYQLKYRETYQRLDYKLHSYVLRNKEVMFDENGNLASVLCTYGKLNISKTATPQEVFGPLKEALSQSFDLSRYEYVDIPSISDIPESGFGSYFYRFYNVNNGYMTDYLTTVVDNTGTIIWAQSYSVDDDVTLDIDKTLAFYAIDQTLRDIYTTDKYCYVSFKFYGPPILVTYNGQYYISYRLLAGQAFANAPENPTYSHFETLIVPLDMISKG